ncbi:2-dehydro-3-deoxygalactonokinase [Pseudoduganella sp. OTU4001]|uniref:2-dehydro-3-deoxygalactonokinase n=1 Tax=Pseudoduganella sp. OTU4001 TaxID=3043854 RepID=UPI00313E92DE
MNTSAYTPKQILGIDWGTSNRRAYLIDANGACTLRHSDDQGMLAVRPHFAQSIEDLLAAMGLPSDTPVIASGMVGSAQGWHEVPYLDASVPLRKLPQHLLRVAPDRFIVPGYCQRGEDIDVMRGEETQLLGALALGHADGWVVLPGTHSKWVLLRDGVIQQIRTFMTGELYATLGAHGTLAPLMGGPESEAAFAEGMQAARRRAPLSNALFRVRARVVAGAMPAADARSFLSGLLIGTEFVAAQDASDTIISIASPALQQLYATAAAQFGLQLDGLDPDRVYCAALARFFD